MRDVNELLKTERQRSAERSSEDGDERVRTADPLRAKQVLSQLSYSPADPYRIIPQTFARERCVTQTQMVGLDRVELSTPRLSSACSNQLSYRPS